MHTLIRSMTVVQVVRGLHYLHKELRVMHRDVKPPNILFNRQGHVKLCDFGISSYLVDSFIQSSGKAGCRPYMAVSCFIF